jgi:hypothetical protein
MIGYRFHTMNETISILLKVTPEFAKAIDKGSADWGTTRQNFFISLAAKHLKFNGETHRKPGRPRGES